MRRSWPYLADAGAQIQSARRLYAPNNQSKSYNQWSIHLYTVVYNTTIPNKLIQAMSSISVKNILWINLWDILKSFQKLYLYGDGKSGAKVLLLDPCTKLGPFG